MTEEKIYDLKLRYKKELRLVRIFVPAHDEGERMPVIYMSDGQNLFEEEKCTFGCWHVREAIREAMEKGIGKAVVVGIYNDKNRQRVSDLTPSTIGKIVYPNAAVKIMAKLFARPGGEDFDDFIVHTVMPIVETSFPVKTGRENTAFCGSSSGGLFSFFTALSNPDKYSYAGVFSPAFVMFSKDTLRSYVSSKLTEEMPELYMYCGKGDDKEMELYPGFETVCDVLEEVYPQGKYEIVVEEEGKHHEEAWEKGFKEFLAAFLRPA